MEPLRAVRPVEQAVRRVPFGNTGVVGHTDYFQTPSTHKCKFPGKKADGTVDVYSSLAAVKKKCLAINLDWFSRHKCQGIDYKLDRRTGKESQYRWCRSCHKTS